MATIRQVAKAAGVSPMTVSFVLNNKPGQVSPETRDRVLRAVRDMDYRPSATRRVPEQRQNLTLGMVAGVAENSLLQPGYYSAVLRGVLQVAEEMRHGVTLFPGSLLHSDTRRAIRVYCDGRCDGLFVLAPSRDSGLVSALQERGVPFVLIGSSGSDETVSCVDIDNVAEARAVVEYLIAQGHRRIGFVGGPDFVDSAGLRREGYRAALAAHGLAHDPRVELSDNVLSGEVRRRVEALMTSAVPRPTALFAWNDGAAVETIGALQGLGLRVPEDVSVMGIDDDVPLATDVRPALTTVRQPYREIGRRAVELLLALVHRAAPGPFREFLSTERVVRASVGPPPGG